MDNATEIIAAFVVERLGEEPLSVRSRLYRALAFTAAPRDRKEFEELAAQCDAIEARHDQLALDFRRRIR